MPVLQDSRIYSWVEAQLHQTGETSPVRLGSFSLHGKVFNRDQGPTKVETYHMISVLVYPYPCALLLSRRFSRT